MAGVSERISVIYTKRRLKQLYSIKKKKKLLIMLGVCLYFFFGGISCGCSIGDKLAAYVSGGQRLFILLFYVICMFYHAFSCCLEKERKRRRRIRSFVLFENDTIRTSNERLSITENSENSYRAGLPIWIFIFNLVCHEILYEVRKGWFLFISMNPNPIILGSIFEL